VAALLAGGITVYLAVRNDGRPEPEARHAARPDSIAVRLIPGGLAVAGGF
jgi:hypothetical protein